MIHTYRYKNITWVDIEQPNPEDIRLIISTYGIEPTIAEELLFATPDQMVEKYSSYLYLVLHFPAWKHTHSGKIQEIDFIIGRDFIITARYDSIDALHKFGKKFEVFEVLERRKTEAVHAGSLFYFMMREIYQSLHDELAVASDMLGDIEEKMFAGKEREMVRELSKLSRELITFRQAMELQDDILSAYHVAAVNFFGEGYEYEMSLIQKEYSQVVRLAAGYTESLDELRDTNDSLLSNKQNEIIKVLTVILFITAVMQIFLGLFAIDNIARSVIGTPNDFWVLLGGLVVIGVTMLMYFSKKDWL